MKPFDLKKALAGAPVVTRGGLPVTQLTRFNCEDIISLYGVVGNTVRSWGKDNGIYYIGTESAYDLFMASEKRSCAVEVWKYDSGRLECALRPSLGRGLYRPLGTQERAVGSDGNRTLVAVAEAEWEE